MSQRYQAGIVLPGYNALKVANAPTIGTATTSSATSLTVSFTAPSDEGGSAITSYIAAAKRTSDGVVFTASGASSPITITGLTAVPFTATVIAVNSYGPSAPSAASNSITPALPAIGSAFGGGYFAGQISTAGNSVADYNIVIGPKASAQTSSKWKNVATATPGADSSINGPQNTADMVADGSSTVYPAAHFCNDLVTGGYSDWYMPARNELEICYYNLKPSTNNNNTATGTNSNAVPARASNYTNSPQDPSQTSATIFQYLGSEAFDLNYYWTSTEVSSTDAARRDFGNGSAYNTIKYDTYRVRAIRRVAV